MRESRWFESGLKEATYIIALSPSLNRDGGRYNLPLVWDIIKKKVKGDRLRRSGGGGGGWGVSSPSCTMSPTTSAG